MAQDSDSVPLFIQDCSTFNIVSYNLHGLNSGRSLSFDLCNDSDTHIIAMQEHGLAPRNLSVLNDIHPDFCGHGISAMHNILATGIYKGRPFGGVGFLWRKAISEYVRIVNNDPEGRCLGIALKTESSVTRLTAVYFQCYI